MDESLRNLFDTVSQNVIGYLPKLFAGIVLILVGWVLGWFVKRLVVQLCIILRLDRLARRFSWGRDFTKADVRLGVYNAIGNVAFVLVFLLLLNSAVDSMQITPLSEVIRRSVLFIPKLLMLVLIIGFGWAVSGWVSNAVRRTLTKEGLPRSSLIARLTKFVLRLFFAAMAVAQLDIAREIVTIGFTVIFCVLGILTIMIAAMAGKEFVARSTEDETESSSAATPLPPRDETDG
jgi:Na+-transporting methylmalonyl-CoA/oxaloacetate decarboxylase gamma subunit